MFRWWRIIGICVLALTACNAANEPPAEFKARRVDNQAHVIVAQVEAYYRASDQSWRALGGGRYALDIRDRDPLTNEPRRINLLFESAPGTATFPEARAPIAEIAINGEPIGWQGIRDLVETIAYESAPPPRSLFQQIAARDHRTKDAPLHCAMDDAADLGALDALDQAFAHERGWQRYERVGGQLNDGTPYTYIGYAADNDSQERVELAVRENAGAIEVFAQQDFDVTGARSDWRSGQSKCAQLAAFIQANTASTQPSANDVGGVTTGMNYTRARQALIDAGFQPLAFPRGGEFDLCITRSICSAYAEITDCSGTGFNPCRFAFARPDGGYLVGVAEGERPDALIVTGIAVANETDVRRIGNLLAGRPALAD